MTAADHVKLRVVNFFQKVNSNGKSLELNEVRELICTEFAGKCYTCTWAEIVVCTRGEK